MNPEKHPNENEHIKLEEQAIGEPQLTHEESDRLSLEKLQENADSELADEKETWREPDFEPEL